VASKSEAPRRIAHRVLGCRKRPTRHRERQSEPRAKTIHQHAHRKLRRHHAERKRGDNPSVIGIAEMKLLPQLRRKHRECLPVDEINDAER